MDDKVSSIIDQIDDIINNTEDQHILWDMYKFLSIKAHEAHVKGFMVFKEKLGGGE